MLISAKLKQSRDSLLYGTFILTAANVFVRFIGFIYRILLSRAIGPEGMGVFQLVIPINTLAFALTASGIPIAVSRLVAERKAVGDLKGVRRVFLLSLTIAISISLLISLIIIFNINWISSVLLKEPRTKGALFVLFPCVLVISVDSVFKGYFYGMKNFHHPAYAEVVEQLTRMALVFIILYNMPSTTITVQAAIASLGMVIGEMASVLYLNYHYHKLSSYEKISYNTPSTTTIINSIIKITLPITGVRLLSSTVRSIDSILIPRRLIESGLSSSDAVSTFGILSGMVLPLLFLPFAFTSALSMVMIPNLSEDIIHNKWTSVRNKVSKAILITSLTAFPISAFLFSLAHPLGMALYQQEEIGRLLMPLSCIAGIHGLQHTLGGILNGLGKQNRAAIHFLVGGTFQIFCTWILVAQPHLGIYGYIIGFIANTIFVTTLHFRTVIYTIKLPVQWTEWFIKPVFASLVTGSVLRLSYLFLSDRGYGTAFALFFASMIGIAVLLLALYATGSLSQLIEFIYSKNSRANRRYDT